MRRRDRRWADGALLEISFIKFPHGIPSLTDHEYACLAKDQYSGRGVEGRQGFDLKCLNVFQSLCDFCVGNGTFCCPLYSSMYCGRLLGLMMEAPEANLGSQRFQVILDEPRHRWDDKVVR